MDRRQIIVIVIASAAAMAGGSWLASSNPKPGGGGADPFLLQSRGWAHPPDLDAWKAADRLAPGLKPYPDAVPGTPNPAGGLAQYGGRKGSSMGTMALPLPFAQWMAAMKAQRPSVDAQAKRNLEARFDLSCKTRPGITMSRSKPQPIGPTARLPRGFATWEAYNAQSPEEMKRGGAFPWKPLDHPLHSTAHMLFPKQWTDVHPEHERFDVGFDIPDCFLPEFPPPIYLTTHPELGDVSRGVEITYANYYQMFDGLVTLEQMEGLRLLVTPFQTTWFNITQHRATEQPSTGVACFSCHVNGHTNGAIELAPDSRPNYARLRTDTPTMRGNYAQLVLSSKRSIRTMDHFAEVEEYFDGDPSMMAAIGGRTLTKPQTNRMGDFNSILDFPPAPKLDPLGRLIPSAATPAELRGEAVFNGKGKCATCHPPAQHFTDNSMHDLQLERFYAGRPEGVIKTFPLRGIKDSPPYFHDGRVLTLEDSVELFDIALALRLTAAEKADLVAFLRAL
ncbi:MAG: cytochrome C [Deltaproteobacteria bacterium]|nr:cytochrome C [Deltaproteobacteria bacterium]